MSTKRKYIFKIIPKLLILALISYWIYLVISDRYYYKYSAWTPIISDKDFINNMWKYSQLALKYVSFNEDSCMIDTSKPPQLSCSQDILKNITHKELYSLHIKSISAIKKNIYFVMESKWWSWYPSWTTYQYFPYWDAKQHNVIYISPYWWKIDYSKSK